MYSQLDWLIQIGKHGSDRPIIQCEYSHAMGNSNSVLKRIWDANYYYPNLRGGFIWDYGDQIFNTIMENELLKVFFIITLMVCFVIFFYFLMSACSGVIKLLLELIGVIIGIYIGIALTNYIINEYLS